MLSNNSQNTLYIDRAIKKVEQLNINNLVQMFGISQQEYSDKWYDDTGVMTSILDLVIESRVDDSKPMIVFEQELLNDIEIPDNRDIIYISRIHNNHFISSYFFKFQNEVKVLTVDPLGDDTTLSSEILKIINKKNTTKQLLHSKSKIQRDGNSCGVITAEIVRILYSSYNQCKEKLKDINKKSVELEEIFSTEQLSKLKASFNKPLKLCYGSHPIDVNGAAYRAVHFITALNLNETIVEHPFMLFSYLNQKNAFDPLNYINNLFLSSFNIEILSTITSYQYNESILSFNIENSSLPELEKRKLNTAKQNMEILFSLPSIKELSMDKKELESAFKHISNLLLIPNYSEIINDILDTEKHNKKIHTVKLVLNALLITNRIDFVQKISEHLKIKESIEETRSSLLKVEEELSEENLKRLNDTIITIITSRNSNNINQDPSLEEKKDTDKTIDNFRIKAGNIYYSMIQLALSENTDTKKRHKKILDDKKKDKKSLDWPIYKYVERLKENFDKKSSDNDDISKFKDKVEQDITDVVNRYDLETKKIKRDVRQNKKSKPPIQQRDISKKSVTTSSRQLQKTNTPANSSTNNTDQKKNSLTQANFHPLEENHPSSTNQPTTVNDLKNEKPNDTLLNKNECALIPKQNSNSVSSSQQNENTSTVPIKADRPESNTDDIKESSPFKKIKGKLNKLKEIPINTGESINFAWTIMIIGIVTTTAIAIIQIQENKIILGMENDLFKALATTICIITATLILTLAFLSTNFTNKPKSTMDKPDIKASNNNTLQNE